jgi:hypothetical protein
VTKRWHSNSKKKATIGLNRKWKGNNVPMW